MLDQPAMAARLRSRRHLPVTPAADPGPRSHAYRLFVVTALVIGLTGGFTLGATLVLGQVTQIWTRGWLAHAQVHGHTQLWGWVLLFATGVLLHVLPRMGGAPQRAGRAIYALLLAGLAARALGQPLADQELFAALFLVSGPLELAAVTLLVVTVTRIRREAGQPTGLWGGYLGAALRWLWIGTALEAWGAISAARAGALLLPGGWHEAALVALLWGFSTLLIAGFSLRMVAPLLHMPAADPRVGALALPLLDLGVALSVAAPLAPLLVDGPVAALAGAAGALLLVLGAAALAHAVRLCPLSQLRTPPTPGTAWYALFIRVAYLWLLVGAALGLVQAGGALLGGGPAGYFAANGARHALTLGFVTMMIFGMGARLLPAFSGRPWRARWLLWGSFAALNASTLLRTALQPTLGYGGASGLLGLAAVLGLLGYALFAAMALLTLLSPAPAAARSDG
ncbi:MAG: NnrS family protein [Chloroflexi bacterium]|nr:NnrS family protein [Chloroflexota bacterium]